MNPWPVAAEALSETDPASKCRRVDALWAALGNGGLDAPPDRNQSVPAAGRPKRPVLVRPHALPRRGLGTCEGRVALLHAVAHIEFNAINLALDAALRFADLPLDYYRDWLSVAFDEARHFRLLSDRLAELGCAYGDLPAHNGLWDMAEKTAHDVLVRMALVPRVLEARGLDVTPGMIERLAAAGDEASVACLEVILAEEVRHVAIGSRWFGWLCAQRGLEPDATFERLLDEHFHGGLRGPFNLQARRQAGFSERELAGLALS
ncbi:MAG: ferritin-like domain-containing protein [Wenzhouxiangellaceae bacterium]|nr:ferritin-like domain-containing protein [Wenzhouxiangellaceae bacterium]